MKYDAAVVGAGANGLAAAIHLAEAGLKVVVVEKNAAPGGRLVTRQFRPGFFASPFCDQVPAMPETLAARLGMAVRPTGDAAPAPPRLAIPEPDGPMARLRARLGRRPEPEEPAAAPILVEAAAGGLGALGEGLAAAATRAGAELRCGLPAVEILTGRSFSGRSRAGGVVLADGEPVEADAVISALDLRRSMFGWRSLPSQLLEQARLGPPTAGRTARLLLALKRPVGDRVLTLPGQDDAEAVWQQNLIPAEPPLRFDPVSARDGSLAPEDGAVATLTLDCIPFRPAEGAWTHKRRVMLAARALARLAPQLPDLLAALQAVEVLVAPDMEKALGRSAGDLGPGAAIGPLTPLPRYYLAHAGIAPGTGAGGLKAAQALLAD